MDNQELSKLLQQLKGEIEKTERVDDKGRAMLSKLDAEIHELLARSANETQPQPGANTLRNLEETITHLEATHPALTALLSSVLETLSNAGI